MSAGPTKHTHSMGACTAPLRILCVRACLCGAPLALAQGHTAIKWWSQIPVLDLAPEPRCQLLCWTSLGGRSWGSGEGTAFNLALAFVGRADLDQEPPSLRPVCSSGEWGQELLPHRTVRRLKDRSSLPSWMKNS